MCTNILSFCLAKYGNMIQYPGIYLAVEVFTEGRWHQVETELPDYRNYTAFAILADVRNGYGFVGFDTGEPVIPTSEPRDFPEDLSEELQALLDRVDGQSILGDGHHKWQ